MSRNRIKAWICGLTGVMVLILSHLAAARAPRESGGIIQGLTLAEDGETLFRIVVADYADPRVMDAALELRNDLKFMTGAEFPILSLSQILEESPTIWIGALDPVRGLADVDKLSDSGYVIAVRGNDLVLAGRTPAGTANAVYGFLQDILGVRWFMPGDEYRWVPKTHKLHIGRLHIKAGPALPVRRLDGVSGPESWKWEHRLRLTGYEDAWPDWSLWPSGSNPFSGVEGVWTSSDGKRAILAQDTARNMDLDVVLEGNRRIESWIKDGCRVVQFDYSGMPWVMPRILTHVIAEDLKFLAGAKAGGYWGWGLATGWMTAPQRYMTARMAWDPAPGRDAYLDEFYNGVFREAAPQMRLFFETIEGQWKRLAPPDWLLGNDDPMAQVELWAGHLDTLIVAAKYLSEAKTAAWDTAVTARIETVSDEFMPLLEVVSGYNQARELKEKEVKNAEDVIWTINQAWKLQLLGTDVTRRLEAAFEADPFAHKKFRTVYLPRFLETWFKLLDDVAATTVMKSLAWADAHTNEPELPLAELSHELLRLYPEMDIKDMAAIAFDGQSNVFQFGGFEDRDKSAWLPASADMEVIWAQAPALVCQGRRPNQDNHFSHTGKSSLLYEAAGAADVQSWSAAEPGAVYSARIWAFVNDYKTQRIPLLQIEFRDELGKVLPEPRKTSWAGQPGMWEPMFLFAQAPEGAKWVVVTFGVREQGGTGAVLFDDLALVKIR